MGGRFARRRRAVMAVAVLWPAGMLAACGTDGPAGEVAAQAAGHGAPADTESAEAEEGTIRRHYIAADEVQWNYAPAGENRITGEAFGEEENVFVAQGGDRIGATYLKSIYREYTDDAFTTLKERPDEWEHLGNMGPLLRAEVGDTIEVLFRNNTPFDASMHPHGVFYDKASEGAPYADGTEGDDKADDAVPPGGTHLYRWEVPERAGPAHGDPSSVMWMYHSHVDEVGDVYAGLMGPIIVTRAGEAKEDGSPKGIDREFFTNFVVADENASPWLDRNVERFAGEPGSVDPEDEDFAESNLMHTINGYVYGSQPGLEAEVGDKVRWYLMAMGTEVDLHTPHWHGNVVTAMGMGRTDVVNLLPASMVIADMTPDAPGTWLFHCHVADHISAGMQSLYTVVE